MTRKSNPSKSLPRFDNPPVIELAFSTQFETLPGFKAVHYGSWQNRIRDRFPNVQDLPPLGEQREIFLPQPANIVMDFFESPPLPRVWYLNADKTELIQLQPNRFAYNWRKLANENPYPSYDKLRKRFTDALNEFMKFVRDEKLGELKHNLCELTYINHIPSNTIWKSHDQLNKILSIYSGKYSEQFLPAAEAVTMNTVYQMKNETGDPIGRLRINVTPDFRVSDKQPLFVMQVFARGSPRTQDFDGAMAFMELAHEWIVRGFTAATTPEMHDFWRRTS